MSYLTGNFSCQEMARLMTEYLEGSLPFGKRMRFRMHLFMCNACRNLFKQLKITVQTLQRFPIKSISPEFKENLLEHFKNWKTTQSSSPLSSDRKSPP